MTFIKYLLQLTLFTVIIVLATFFFNYLIPNSIQPYFYLVIAFFYFLASITGVLMRRFSGLRMAKFSSSFMILSTVKLFVLIIVIGVLIYLYKKEALALTIYFLILYFGYSVFEVLNTTIYIKEQNFKREEHKSEAQID